MAIGSYFLVPFEWFSEWRKFVSDVDVDEQPASIENSVFLCEHQGLTIDPSVQTATTDPANKICFLPEDLWRLLRNQYVIYRATLYSSREIFS